MPHQRDATGRFIESANLIFIHLNQSRVTALSLQPCQPCLPQNENKIYWKIDGRAIGAPGYLVPRKKNCINIALLCSTVGPWVTSQQVGQPVPRPPPCLLCPREYSSNAAAQENAMRLRIYRHLHLAQPSKGSSPRPTRLPTPHRCYSNRAAREAGRPRAQAKTPRQLRLLGESFADEPYPVRGGDGPADVADGACARSR